MLDRMAAAIERKRKGIPLMTASSLCVCIGQLFRKRSASRGILVSLPGSCCLSVS